MKVATLTIVTPNGLKAEITVPYLEVVGVKTQENPSFRVCSNSVITTPKFICPDCGKILSAQESPSEGPAVLQCIKSWGGCGFTKIFQSGYLWGS